MRRRRTARFAAGLALLALVFLPAAALAQDAEPNDDFTTAVPLRMPADFEGCLDPAGDVDVYIFAVPEGADVSAETPSDNSWRLDLFDARQNLLVSGDGAVLLPGAAAGEYFLRVSRDAVGCYRLAVSFSLPPPPPPPPVDLFEPNDDFATATRISLPFGADACIDPQTDVDFYVFSVPDGARIAASAISDSRQLFRLDLFDGRRGLVVSGPGSLELPGAAASEYFLRVSADAAGCYRLSVSAEVPPPPPPPPSDPFEPNDDFASATPITPNRFLGLSGAVLTVGDLDFYRFDAGAGSELLVTAGSSEVDPLVGLFDATGQLLAAGSAVRLRLPAAGTYFVGVTTADDTEFRGARDEGAYTPSVFVFVPRVLVPGHPFEFATPLPFGLASPLPFGSTVAVDPDAGVVYGLGLVDASASRSRLVRLAGGGIELVSEAFAPAVDIPFGGTTVHIPGLFWDLEFAGGFGGADLLATDTVGQTIALSTAGGPQRLFADTRGGFFASLALSGDRLFVSSGFRIPLDESAIYAVDGAGFVSNFLVSPALSSPPLSLALSPDTRTLYYKTLFSGDLVQVDVQRAAEVGRVHLGPPLSLSNIAVDPASGDVYATVIDLAALLAGPDTRLGGVQLVRYDQGTGQVQPFAEDLPLATDLTFGPCAEERSSQEWCLFVPTAFGLMKFRGFDPPFVRDPVGDAPAGIDVRRLGARYVDLAGSGSSTHFEVTLRLAAEPREGEFHALVDYGETAELGADVDLRLDLAGGQPRWSGLKGLADRSFVRGREIHFLAPIEPLRRAATDEQKLAAAERIRLWATSAAGASTDRAPDGGSFGFRSFYPRLALMPGTLDFGKVRVGRRAVREVAVTNVGVGPAPITNVQVTGLGLSLAGPVPTSIGEGETVRVPIACDAFRASLIEGKLHVRSQAPIGDRQATLRCAGFEFVPFVFLDPSGDAQGLFSGIRNVPDLLRIGYDLQGDQAILTLTYDRPVAFFGPFGPPLPGGPAPVSGAVEFDLDRDSSTGQCIGCGFGPGGPQYGIGAERTLSFGSVVGEIPLGGGLTATASADGDTLRFGIPADWLDGGACLNFGTFTVSPFEPVDWAPNGEGSVIAIEDGCAEAQKGGGKPIFAGTPRWDRISELLPVFAPAGG